MNSFDDDNHSILKMVKAQEGMQPIIPFRPWWLNINWSNLLITNRKKTMISILASQVTAVSWIRKVKQKKPKAGKKSLEINWNWLLKTFLVERTLGTWKVITITWWTRASFTRTKFAKPNYCHVCDKLQAKYVIFIMTSMSICRNSYFVILKVE